MDILIIMLILGVAVISALLVWLNLPGSFLMFIFVAIWSWIDNFSIISVAELLLLFVLLLSLEIMEYALSGLAAKFSGAENRSAYRAILGGLLGTIILGSMFFILGAVIGLFLGSYLGAYWGELQSGKTKQAARKAALGALMGTLAAKAIKSATTIVIGVWMIKEVI